MRSTSRRTARGPKRAPVKSLKSLVDETCSQNFNEPVGVDHFSTTASGLEACPEKVLTGFVRDGTPGGVPVVNENGVEL